jgi:serine/threonine-protein kinase
MVSPTGVVAIPPTTFGKYTLVARTGRGGMADIYLAIAAGPSGFRKLVVIKRLREAYEDDKRLVDMFMDEARLGARLEHPNVVHTLEHGDSEGRHFLAMEFLEGQTLARILRRKIRAGEEVPLDFVLYVASEVLEGLHYAHELEDFDGSPLNVVHRDVTPANIMITYPGVVKVLDFGVAKAATQMTETDPDVRKGKFAYLAPEQIEGRVDRRSDLFSLGVILWEALAGRRLFYAPDPAQTIKKTLSAPIPRIGIVTRRKLPEGVDDMVQKALKRNAANRFQTAQEMRAAIEEIVSRDGIALRRKDVAAFMADVFADLREQHGRDLQAAVGAGLETATAMFEVLSPLESPTVGEVQGGDAKQERPAAGDPEAGHQPEGTSPTMPGVADEDSVAIPGLDMWVSKRRALMAGGGVLAGLLLLLIIVVASSGDEEEQAHFGVADAPDESAADTTDSEPDEEEPPSVEPSPDRPEPNLEDFERYRVEAREAYVAGDYRRAARAYEMATEMNPVHAGSFAGLGASQLALGNVDEGLVAYQEAVRLAPTHSGFHAALGRAYRQAGRDDLAMEAYSEALRLDRTNRAARRALRELRQAQ